MSTASILRNRIESALSGTMASALSPSPRVSRSVMPTGIREVDAVLEGGLALGAITELVGTPCSGRSSMALACLSAHTQAGNVCAWVDVDDALDPESATACGVHLEQLLWVRCGSIKKEIVAQDQGHAVATVEGISFPMRMHNHGGGSPHPRSEGRDMPEAISAMLRAHGGLYDRHVRREKKAVGTPGNPNRPLPSRSKDRVEQVNIDRLPPRRGENLALIPCCSEPQPRRPANIPSKAHLWSGIADLSRAQRTNSWHALDQAIRAADLLLQSGGFSMVVLDLGDVPPEIAWRIPLATWFRFRAACERTRTSLLLLTQHPCARSSAEQVVRMESGVMESDGKVMTGILYQAAVERQRNRPERVVPIRKPPQSERSFLNPGQWRSEAPWAQGQ